MSTYHPFANARYFLFWMKAQEAMLGVLQTATVADTLCDIAVETPIHATPIDPPTLAMTISVNDSPLAGREGDKMQLQLSPDQASQILNGLSLDGTRRLEMSDKQGAPPKDRKGRNW